MAYMIVTERCAACEKCVDECPMDAIARDRRGRYGIDPDACTDCGSCADLCPEEAVRGS